MKQNGSIYTQKKKFSQYLCFLIKSTILDISLSNCIHELSYRNFTCICLLCDKKCLYIDCINQISKYTMCKCCGKLAGLFSHMLFDIDRELFILQKSGENSVLASFSRSPGYQQITEMPRLDFLKQAHMLLSDSAPPPPPPQISTLFITWTCCISNIRDSGMQLHSSK